MSRIEILKTYKIFVGGQFTRTESGQFYALKLKNNRIVNMCLSSRKDFKNAVLSASSAFSNWSLCSTLNRGLIIYRIAEILEARKEQFILELKQLGYSSAKAKREVEQSIDRLLYYAGWCDKYQRLSSSTNSLSSSYFNISVSEPLGVVGILADENTGLLGLVSVIAPCIAGGNTCVVLASHSKAITAITFAEVLATSDVPAGVINILTGSSQELRDHLASHMQVSAIVICSHEKEEKSSIVKQSSLNVKRLIYWVKDWSNEKEEGLSYIFDLQEIKTIWHSLEQIGVSGLSY